MHLEKATIRWLLYKNVYLASETVNELILKNLKFSMLSLHSSFASLLTFLWVQTNFGDIKINFWTTLNKLF